MTVNSWWHEIFLVMTAVDNEFPANILHTLTHCSTHCSTAVWSSNSYEELSTSVNWEIWQLHQAQCLQRIQTFSHELKLIKLTCCWCGRVQHLRLKSRNVTDFQNYFTGHGSLCWHWSWVFDTDHCCPGEMLRHFSSAPRQSYDTSPATISWPGSAPRTTVTTLSSAALQVFQLSDNYRLLPTALNILSHRKYSQITFFFFLNVALLFNNNVCTHKSWIVLSW